MKVEKLKMVERMDKQTAKKWESRWPSDENLPSRDRKTSLRRIRMKKRAIKKSGGGG